ncbi:MAG: L-ribulose-5-phosphate 4-epimerase AraD [Gemmatimonadales bacterium]|jgi:L-ribulose-5-phosphate 4-epimerase|nr:L-ribulose-5-phosphate 4-epimerase AraD [Gemmatimonadales bacterium]
MDHHRTLKETAWAANQDLNRRTTILYTFGNVSAADRERGVFAIKPSGVPYDDLRPADMVVVDFDGRVVEGRLRPSSDTPTHAVLYRAFPGIGGVGHTHSTYAVAWAQARRPIPILGTTHADLLPEDVPCTAVMTEMAVAGDYETATGELIVACFRARSWERVPMVLVAGHGPFAWGPTAESAVHHCVMLEELARTAWLTVALDPAIGRLEPWLVRKHFGRKHGPDAYYGQEQGSHEA